MALTDGAAIIRLALEMLCSLPVQLVGNLHIMAAC